MAKQPKLISPTPGPWLIDEHSNVYAEKEGDRVELIGYIYHQGDNGERGDANRRLVAKLPVLLQLLKELHDDWEGGFDAELIQTRHQAKIGAFLSAIEPSFFLQTV